MSETTEALAPERRCHGYCGLPIPAGKLNTYTVIGPDGTLREFCDGDCLGTYYLGASREGDEQARLATVVRALEAAARAGPFDVVLVRLVGGPWTCEISTPDEPHPGGSRQQAAPDGGRSGLAVEGTGETIEAAIAGAHAHATGSGAPTGGAPG